MTRQPTREEAIGAAAEIYLEAKIRIETERAIAEATAQNEEAAGTAGTVTGGKTPKGSDS